MKNINYIFKKFSQRFTISCLAVTSCFLSSVAQAGTPDTNWSINSTMTDCYGMADECATRLVQKQFNCVVLAWYKLRNECRTMTTEYPV